MIFEVEDENVFRAFHRGENINDPRLSVIPIGAWVTVKCGKLSFGARKNVNCLMQCSNILVDVTIIRWDNHRIIYE